jgi:phospholipid/cholesterol/gamma-HCH transport system substrate-binding protein
MKRRNEFAVGVAVLAALFLVIAGALWLSEADLNQKDAAYTARFRTVEGLQVGSPVTLRGVKVGKVVAIRLVANAWVETEFSIDRDVQLPQKPAVIAASASLFGGWSANIVPLEPLPDDPIVRGQLIEAGQGSGSAWPGATLPDIGQLTAQASRIATDVANVTQRIQGAFDSTALRQLRQSVLDLAAISNRLVKFAGSQTTRIDQVSANLATTSDAFAGVTRSLDATVARVDSATNQNQLREIMNNGRDASGDIRQASADFRQLMATMRANDASLVRILQSADSLLGHIQAGNGTLGKLATDSTLYYETAMTMRQFRELLADIQAHPKKYIKVSVF